MRRSHKMVSSLDSMDNEIFNTPLLPKDGNEVLIRTGAIGEGSCFFHAILTAYSSIYRKWNKREKYDYVRKLRHKLANSLTVDKWKEIGYALAINNTQIKIHDIFEKFYKFFSKKDNRKSSIKSQYLNIIINEILGHEIRK